MLQILSVLSICLPTQYITWQLSCPYHDVLIMVIAISIVMVQMIPAAQRKLSFCLSIMRCVHSRQMSVLLNA